MLTLESLINEIYQIIHHTIDISNSELVYSEEMQQGNKVLTSYYYLYFNYEYNCIIHYKELTSGILAPSGDVINEETIGYEILKCYKFR